MLQIDFLISINHYDCEKKKFDIFLSNMIDLPNDYFVLEFLIILIFLQ